MRGEGQGQQGSVLSNGKKEVTVNEMQTIARTILFNLIF